ncbi:MAG: molybdate ABC transporter permease subunit [Parasporobacterium sp.]|nr:molybdate ABC transporter permease subunit [Parasporobacterium sp.]
MDMFPLLNSLRIAGISTVIILLTGIPAAYYIAKTPRVIKGVLDVILTLPLVLPPTVVGYLLLRVLGPKHAIGAWFLETFNVKLTMTWWSAIFATVVVIFPLMYRTARGAFEAFDETLAYAGRTLGLSRTYIFWRIRLPYCRQGILAGTVLAFARALGEYGATSMISGYTPGRTATISTTVYQLWRTNDDALAFRWVMVNLAISFVVLLAVNLLERKNSPSGKRRNRQSRAVTPAAGEIVRKEGD